MTTTDKFSIKRFGAVLSQYFCSNKKQLLGGVIVVLGLLTLIAFVIGTVQKNNITDLYEVGRYNTANERYMNIPGTQFVFFTMSFCLFSMVSASLTCCSFKNKKRRITSLMLPAAKSEMFLARVLIYSVLGNIMFFMCGIIADALRSIFVYGPTTWAAQPMDSIFSAPEYWWFFISCTMLNQAIFTLGSALWPRNSFAKTFGAMFALSMFSTMVAPIFAIAGELFLKLFGLDEGDFTAPIIATILFAISIIVYWLAWLRFKHTQVVQNFMTT